MYKEKISLFLYSSLMKTASSWENIENLKNYIMIIFKFIEIEDINNIVSRYISKGINNSINIKLSNNITDNNFSNLKKVVILKAKRINSFSIFNQIKNTKLCKVSLIDNLKNKINNRSSLVNNIINNSNNDNNLNLLKDENDNIKNLNFRNEKTITYRFLAPK